MQQENELAQQSHPGTPPLLPFRATLALRISGLGMHVKVRRGPFTRRLAYLIAELARRAEIDILLGIEDY